MDAEEAEITRRRRAVPRAARAEGAPALGRDGSVDDGKSTLIGRLLHDTRRVYEDQLSAVTNDGEGATRAGSEAKVDFSLLTDGLRAEREQGITIDVAYRYFSRRSASSSSPTRPATSSTRATWRPARRPRTSR